MWWRDHCDHPNDRLTPTAHSMAAKTAKGNARSTRYPNTSRRDRIPQPAATPMPLRATSQTVAVSGRCELTVNTMCDKQSVPNVERLKGERGVGAAPRIALAAPSWPPPSTRSASQPVAGAPAPSTLLLAGPDRRPDRR